MKPAALGEQDGENLESPVNLHYMLRQGPGLCDQLAAHVERQKAVLEVIVGSQHVVDMKAAENA